MKTTKKIFAAFLAVMMLALMIPFSASAAGYSVKITGHKDFEFKIYKVADYSTTDGFTNVVNDSTIKSVLSTATNGKYDFVALRDACDAYTFTNSVATFTEKYEDTSIEPGVYYVKATKLPATYTAAGNSVFAVPYVNDDGRVISNVEVNAGTKCVNGGEVLFDKYFTDYQNDSYISASLNDTVKYTIKASVVGSSDAKLKSYEIKDTMSAGLSFNNDVAVTLKNATGEKLLTNADYTVRTTDTESTFDVVLTSNLLNSNEFYSYTDVYVTYTAKVNEGAVIAGEGNPNEAKLVYTNANNESVTKNDAPITVYTFKIDVKKVDAANENNVLAGAKFTLTNDKGVSKEVVTNESGTGVFERLAAGKYTLQETEAPDGYLLDPTAYTVTISYDVANGTATPTITSGATVENNVVKITNNRMVVPATGGMGTMMFTIGGAALILFAGILFLVVRKKSA